MDLIVLKTVREGNNTLLQRVARIPVRWEMHAVRVAQVTGQHILRETRVLVGSDSVTLSTGILLGVKILGVNGSSNVESVSVIG